MVDIFRPDRMPTWQRNLYLSMFLLVIVVFVLLVRERTAEFYAVEEVLEQGKIVSAETLNIDASSRFSRYLTVRFQDQAGVSLRRRVKVSGLTFNRCRDGERVAQDCSYIDVIYQAGKGTTFDTVVKGDYSKQLAFRLPWIVLVFTMATLFFSLAFVIGLQDFISEYFQRSRLKKK
jgi:hypothetical protein